MTKIKFMIGRKMTGGSDRTWLLYPTEAWFPFVCNSYSVFMIYIRSDNKSNIKHDFTLLESDFINYGEDIVPLLMWNQWRNGVIFIFYEKEHVSPLFATYILFLMVYIISDYKDNIKYVFTILESYSINKRQKDCLWKQRTHYRLENESRFYWDSS